MISGKGSSLARAGSATSKPRTSSHEVMRDGVMPQILNLRSNRDKEAGSGEKELSGDVSNLTCRARAPTNCQ